MVSCLREEEQQLPKKKVKKKRTVEDRLRRLTRKREVEYTAMRVTCGRCFAFVDQQLAKYQAKPDDGEKGFVFSADRAIRPLLGNGFFS